MSELSLEIRDLVEIARSAPPEAHWIIRDVLPTQAKVLLSAQHKSFKSTIALDLAYSVATGCHFLGEYPVEVSGDVVYFDAELREADLRLWIRRLMAARGHAKMLNPNVGWGMEHTVEFIHSASDMPINLRQPDIQKALMDYIAEHRPALVVCDPFYELSGYASPNRTEEVQQVLSFLSRVRDLHGASVMLVHHERKPQMGEEGREYYAQRASNRTLGSQVFGAWWDAFWSVHRGSDSEPVINWERHFRSIGGEHVARLRFDMEELSREKEEQDLIPRYNVIVERAGSRAALEEHDEDEKVTDMIHDIAEPDEHIRFSSLASELGWSKERLRRVCARLEERGILRFHEAHGKQPQTVSYGKARLVELNLTDLNRSKKHDSR